MKIIYANDKVQKQCTSVKEAQKRFGGDKQLATKLLSRIEQIKAASVIKDIIVIKPMRFHALEGKKEGLFAIDVKTKKEPWRIIMQPLDENEKAFDPCNIDEIAGTVKIVEISEVSKHYE